MDYSKYKFRFLKQAQGEPTITPDDVVKTPQAQPTPQTQPTGQPTVQPTDVQPTGQPTAQPTGQPTSPQAPTETVKPVLNVNQNLSYALKNKKEISIMQRSMIELSKTIMAGAKSQRLSARSPQQDKKMEQGDTETVESKKGFNDFIAENYIQSLPPDKKGREWTTNTSANTLKSKKPTETDIYELDVVMDTIRRIGSSSNEFKEDGVWDDRTQNALKNMMGFAWALLQVESDLGLKQTYYSLRDWNRLSVLINSYGRMKPQQIGPNAKEISKHLENIKYLYTNFQSKVLGNPKNRMSIEGKLKLDDYSRVSKEDMSLAETKGKDLYVTGLNLTFTNQKYQNDVKLNQVPLLALTSAEEFKNYMVNVLHYTEDEVSGKAPSELLKKIKDQIEALPGE